MVTSPEAESKNFGYFKKHVSCEFLYNWNSVKLKITSILHGIKCFFDSPGGGVRLRLWSLTQRPFARVVVTKCHTLGGLKSWKCIVSSPGAGSPQSRCQSALCSLKLSGSHPYWFLVATDLQALCGVMAPRCPCLALGSVLTQAFSLSLSSCGLLFIIFIFVRTVRPQLNQLDQDCRVTGAARF